MSLSLRKDNPGFADAGARVPRRLDPEFRQLVEMCARLSCEKASLEERVERLEAELEDFRRDEQARERADLEETEFQMRAMARAACERSGWRRG